MLYQMMFYFRISQHFIPLHLFPSFYCEQKSSASESKALESNLTGYILRMERYGLFFIPLPSRLVLLKENEWPFLSSFILYALWSPDLHNAGNIYRGDLPL